MMTWLKTQVQVSLLMALPFTALHDIQQRTDGSNSDNHLVI